jgi:predicted DsbA family dithiol-disulfide isomerase
VGLRRFVDARAARGADVRLRVRAWPLEVVNGVPLDPAFIDEEVEEIRDQVARALFAGFDPARFPASSMPALAVAAAANDAGAEVGERVSLELRDLLFEQGIDIADADTLHGLAAAHGLEVDPTDHRAVLADHAEGVRRGVVGSPHFFAADGSWFCPALEVSRDETGHLRIAADPAAFDRFLAACLD